MSLAKLSSYSADQLQALASTSAAFQRYSNFVNENPMATAPSDRLRLERHRRWLEAVAATAYQTATTSEICLDWSKTADSILVQAWEISGLREEGCALFAMGKLGARELNLSSDVDLIVVTQPAAAHQTERKLRTFRKLVADNTEFGFCFRVDFDLRPGGRSSPTATTFSQFQDHYWSRGETWEKMALVRLRALTGAPDVIQNVMENARHFSYRKFLDFHLLEDLKRVRSRIHQESFDARPDEVHIKLEKGGIRDIELFVNALQILHGGKLPKLQTASTDEALSELERLKILRAGQIRFLRETYWEYRRFENLSQALDDRQTHFLFWPCPWNIPAWPPRGNISALMKSVDETVSDLLEDTALPEEQLPKLDQQATWLKDLGFNQKSIEDVWPTMVSSTELSQKTDRDERSRKLFLFRMITALSKTTNDKDLGLSLLSDFLRATRAKASFFAVLNREPRLLEDFARLFSFSPYLGTLFVARPDLIDNFVLNVIEPLSPDFETMLDEMAERKFLSEIIGSIRFLKDLDTPALLEALSYTADELTTTLLNRLVQELDAAPMHLLTLGKWGGEELGFKSDLDFIFLSEQPPGEKEHRVAKRFISRLTDPYRGGSLYDIDLRLRPSGKAGPILTTKDRLSAYLRDEADVWERQAYLRARTLTGAPFDASVLQTKDVQPEELKKLAEIRTQLLKPDELAALDLKYTSGGLVDIEFASQVAALVFKTKSSSNTLENLQVLAKKEWLNGGEALAKNYERLRLLEQLFCLAGSLKNSEARLEQESFSRCARFLKRAPDLLFLELQEILKVNREILSRLDPRQIPTS
jgi:[glutamine synthetase] adenylyltransferase / [glutamine synthetase]-adenylyl-L-tyrosine phosphorylase